MAAQGFDWQRCRGGVVRHQAFVAGLVFAGHYHNVAHVWEGRQTALDFAGLDPETTDLHLQIIAPLVQQGTVGLPAGKVAGAVQQAFTERVEDEFFGRQLRLVQVPLGHACTADVQLADHTQRQRLLARIQHIGLCICDRSADRHSARARRGDFKRGREGGGFGRPVAV